jgi:hypothetical protein
LRAELAQAFYETTDTAASQSALADACTVTRCVPETFHQLVIGFPQPDVGRSARGLINDP